MAFFRKAGSLLRQTVSSGIKKDISVSHPSILQAIRRMSTSKLFIGGLSYNTDDMTLRDAFDKYGQVVEARVIVDRTTGRSRGFGFVTYSSTEEASAAIQALDQQELHGRMVKVNYANERPRTYGGGFGGGYGSGSGYGGNYSGGGGTYGSGGGNYGSGGYVGGAGGDTYPAGGESQTGGGNYGSSNSYDGYNGGADGGSYRDADDSADTYADRRG